MARAGRNRTIVVFSAGFVSALLLVWLSGAARREPPPPAASEDPSALVAELRGADRVLLRDAALVLTMDPGRGEGPLGALEGADVLIEGGRLLAVGPRLDAAGAVIVDATGRIVMPGFVDVHDHLWQTLIRGCATDRDVSSWLDACVFPMFVAGLTEAEAHAAVRLGAAGLVETGITTVLDVSHAFSDGFVTGNLRALDESGLRYVFAHCGVPVRVEKLAALREALEQRSLAVGLQVCSHPDSRFASWLGAGAAAAHELGLGMNVHLAESAGDRVHAPVDQLVRAGAFAGRVTVNHAIHLDDDELDLLARHDVVASYNPSSNMRLGAGVMRVGDLRARGIQVGLGLDGGANDMADAFANMRAAVGLQRAVTGGVDAVPSVAEVIRMATLGGAEVLGIDDEVGSLSPGKRADLVVLDPSSIHFAPRWNWPVQIVFNGRPSDVALVFIDGRIRKAGGRVLDIDTRALVREVEEAAARIHGRTVTVGGWIEEVRNRLSANGR